MTRSVLYAVLAMTVSAASAREIRIAVASPAPPMEFAVRQLVAAVQGGGDQLVRVTNAAADISVSVASPAGATDGFTLDRAKDGHLVISGQNVRGAMYGVLEVAEQIRLGTPLVNISPESVLPPMEFRAIKFNLPFAAYRTSAAIEQHQAMCKDLKFWAAFLDMMAQNRFNTLTLWSLHPFHYLIVPKSFPEAQTFTDAEMKEYHALFTAVFKMAKERGIETYLVNWNTFVSPAFAKAHHVAEWSEDWKFFGAGTTNQLVIDYTRECVAQVIDEYPDLTGLGITLGERMGEQTPDERRDWLQSAFFDGIAKANRPIKFLYRAPLSADTKSGGTTSEENDRRTRAQIESLTNNVIHPVYVEFKHNWSHAHSSPDLFIVHGGKLSDMYWNPPPTQHKVVWTMRNEDMFVLRWGQPDFIRDFVRTQTKDYVGGAIIGSECYIPALDYISKDGPQKNWQYAFERQWLFYTLWGHLLFNPSTPDARFEAMFDARFGEGRGADLLAAWKLASTVPLRFASFFQGRADGTLYTEGFSSWRDNGERKLFDINSFITHPVLDTRRYVNIADFVKTGEVPADGFSPVSLAAKLDQEGASALKLVAQVRAAGKVSPQLDAELTDIEAWCAFGNYFADKLRAGVALATARDRKDPQLQSQAVAELEKGLADWKRLAVLGAKFNQLPILSNSKEPFSWAALTPAVAADIELAKAPLTGGTKP